MKTNRKIIPEKYCNLNFKKSVTSWDEAIPLGNGLMGCLIWGEGDALRFSLDRGDIWDNTLYSGVLEDNFTYKTLVDMAKRQDTDSIRKIFDAPFYNTTPTKLPAGKIILHFNDSTNVKSALDLATAQANITVETNEENISISSFIHANKNIGFIKVNRPSEQFRLELLNPEFGALGEDSKYTYDADAREVSVGSLKQLKYPKAQKSSVDLGECHIEYFTQYIDESLTYGIIVGTKSAKDSCELAYTIVNSSDNDAPIEAGIKLIQAALAGGYDSSFETHQAWWADYWGKSSLTLPDKLFEKQWYLTNYLFGSCSRKNCPPMPLQGVWTADDGKLPPWKGDYHHDLNTQMSYYHYLKANHIEEGESFIDFLWNLAEQGENFSREFYGVDGLCLPAVMTIKGKPLGGWAMYALSPTNQLWLCQVFERHYRFTGDEAFLREKAYPYMKKSADCCISLMEKGEDGRLRLPVSSSPEIHDDTPKAWLTPNSNYDLSMIRYVVIELIRLAKILGNGEELYWESIFALLPELAVNDDNVLMLSPDESLQESHRHHAHAMAIHPLRLLDSTKPEDKAIIDATIHNLEILGTGWWVGYSFTWIAEFYAIQGNGNGAAYQLEVFWRNHCSQNGFHLNGDFKNRGTSQFHYRPFTLEGNMCAADALQEMLLKTEDNRIVLFPAIPEEWLEETVAFESFRGENGLLISAKMEGGKLTGLTLTPQRTGKIRLEDASAVRALTANIPCIIDENGEMELEAGNEYIFS